MPHHIVIGLAAGLASALLFVSATAGGLSGRMVLFFLAPLPIYLAGLGWGAGAAVLAALASTGGAALILGEKSGLVYFCGNGVPAVVLSYLTLLRRTVALPSAAVTDAPGGALGVEWYPIGRLLATATLLAGALAVVTLFMIGADIEELRRLTREFVDQVVLKKMPGLDGSQLSDKDVAALSEMLVYALPAGSAFVWLAGFVLNLWLAGQITRASGRLARPWPDIAMMRFPRGFALGLAGTLVASAVLSGVAGLAASAFAGAFFCGYVLMGLAIIHYGTRGMPVRPFILWGVYVGLFVLNTWAALVIALIALLEPLLPWRRPLEPPSPAPPPSAPAPPA